MKTAKIADLKNNLSRYLNEVRRGESIMIFDRDEAIAEIVPAQTNEEGIPVSLARLEKLGLARRGPRFGKPRPESWYRAKRPGAGAGLLDALLEERATGW